MKSPQPIFTLFIVCALPMAAWSQSLDKPALPDFKPLPPKVQELYKEADESIKAKNYPEAVNKLKQAQLQAEQLPKEDRFRNEVVAGAILRQAQTKIKGNNPADLEASLELFNQVAGSDKLGTPRQRAVAAMNSATVLMMLKRPGEAADAIKKSDWREIDRSQYPVLLFNYARALEDSEQSEKAIRRYARSLSHDPNYESAAIRLQQLAIKYVGQDEQKILEVGQIIVEEGATPNTVRFAVQIMNQKPPPFEPEQNAAAEVLLRAWSKSFVSAKRFEEDYESLLDRLLDSPWKELVSEVRTVIRPETSPAAFASPTAIKKAFPWCTSWERSQVRQGFAAFLAASARPEWEAAGGKEQAGVSAKRAFARVYAAWKINPNDFDICQRVAWMTHDFRKDVDPDGKVRDELITSMIHEKSKLYDLQGKNAKDWENILRMHTSLGLIFEADGKWGSEKLVASSIAQWSFAINAEQRIRELEPEADFRAPGLHEHLASCLLKKDRWQDAFDHLLKAAEGHLVDKNFERARLAADQARKLVPKANPESVSRLSLLEAEIKQLLAIQPKDDDAS